MSGELRLVDAECDRIAASWVMRLSEGELSADEISEWLGWCEADPANKAAFDEMSDMWEAAGKADRDRILALGGGARELDRGKAPRPWLWRSLAAGMALAITVTGILIGTARDGDRSVQVARFETQRGDVQSAKLGDGSTVDLGGRSALSVRYTRQSRLVIAEGGEAFFEVAKNPERPFVVQAGPITVTAVGTAFSVQRDGNSVSVLVTEGVVEVRAQPTRSAAAAAIEPTILRVAAGQRLRFDRGELIKSVETGAVDPVSRWREGRLEFRDEPLRLVVARINRYSDMQIAVSDGAIEDLRVTATVYDNRVRGWLNGIQTVLPVKVRYTADGNAIISSATASS